MVCHGPIPWFMTVSEKLSDRFIVARYIDSINTRAHSFRMTVFQMVEGETLSKLAIVGLIQQSKRWPSPGQRMPNCHQLVTISGRLKFIHSESTFLYINTIITTQSPSRSNMEVPTKSESTGTPPIQSKSELPSRSRTSRGSHITRVQSSSRGGIVKTQLTNRSKLSLHHTPPIKHSLMPTKR